MHPTDQRAGKDRPANERQERFIPQDVGRGTAANHDRATNIQRAGNYLIPSLCTLRVLWVVQLWYLSFGHLFYFSRLFFGRLE